MHFRDWARRMLEQAIYLDQLAADANSAFEAAQAAFDRKDWVQFSAHRRKHEIVAEAYRRGLDEYEQMQDHTSQ